MFPTYLGFIVVLDRELGFEFAGRPEPDAVSEPALAAAARSDWLQRVQPNGPRPQQRKPAGVIEQFRLAQSAADADGRAAAELPAHVDAFHPAPVPAEFER